MKTVPSTAARVNETAIERILNQMIHGDPLGDLGVSRVLHLDLDSTPELDRIELARVHQGSR